MKTTNKSTYPKLVHELTALALAEQKLVAMRRVKTAVSPATLRALEAGTNVVIERALEKIDLDALAACQSQDDFDRFLKACIQKVGGRIKHKNPDKGGGAIWGYGAKAVNLYFRSIVLESRYYSDTVVKRLKRLLRVPVDRILLDRLRELGVTTTLRAIKDIDSKQKYDELQSVIAAAAEDAGVPPIHFDDVWSKAD